MAVDRDVAMRDQLTGLGAAQAGALEIGAAVTLAFRVAPDDPTERKVEGCIVRIEPNHDDGGGTWPHRMAIEFLQPMPEIDSLLFGEVLGISANEIVPVAVLGAVCVAAIVVMYRPLLLSSVMPELGEARGVRAYRIEICFLLVVALATSMALPVVGALLIFSLMIGPPAAARSVTARPMLAMALSVVLALVTVWVAIAASYVSNWPIGFYVGTIAALCYAAGRAWTALRSRRLRRIQASALPPATPTASAVA